MVFKTCTQAFSGGFCAQKRIGSVKDLLKLSSTLQHLLITSDWDIGSGDIRVGSCLPSYLKAGCFRSWRGCTRWLTNEKTTWSPMTPLFFKVTITRRMASTWLPQVLYSTNFLGFGGRQQSFLEAGIQSSKHGTRTFSIQLLYPLDHKPSTRFGFQAGVPIHIPRQRQDWWCSGQEQGRRNIEKSGNGDEFQGMPNRNEWKSKDARWIGE